MSYGPIVLIESAHDTGDDDVLREIILQLTDRFAPIGSSFFGYQFDVQEGGLPWTIVVSTCSTSDDTRRDIGDLTNINWEVQLTRSLSKLNVLVTANPHPASKPRRIMSAEYHQS